MAVKTIIYSQVDQEPQSFCESDAKGDTFSFSVNLSIDCRAAGPYDNMPNDEEVARGRIVEFLEAAPDMSIAIYRYRQGDPCERYDEQFEEVRETKYPGSPAELVQWLDEQKLAVMPAQQRFWAPLELTGSAEQGVETSSAGAGDRLRAVQSWNAPVGHGLGLTRIVRLSEALFSDTGFIAVPFAKGAPAPNPLPALVETGTVGDDDWFGELSYDPFGDGRIRTLRTRPIGTKASAWGVRPFALDKETFAKLTAEGFLVTNPHAAEVHRVTRWFEQRAASMMMTAAALGPRDGSKTELERIENLCTKPVTEPTDYPEFLWSNATWYGVSRLVASLDNLVISVMQPGEPGSPTEPEEPSREGDMLAPFVSSILYHLGEIEPPLEDKWLDPVKIVGAIRKVLRTQSPLVADTGKAISDAALAWALNLVHAIPAPASSPIVEDAELVAEFVSRFKAGDPNAVLNDRLKDYRVTAAKQNLKFGETITRAFSEFEQHLNDETGAEMAIVRFLETVSGEDGAAGPNHRQFADKLIALLQGANDLTTAAVRLAFERAWIEYRGLLDGPFNGAEAVRQTAGGCFTRQLLDALRLTPEITPSDVEKALVAAEYFERRFFTPVVASDLCFDEILKPLIKLDAKWTPVADEASLRRHLAASFADAADPIEDLTKPRRFVPDQFPRPLPVQIAANIDGGKVDEFAKSLNGIALAIRRLDNDKVPFAHAHLADLYWTWPPVAKFEPERKVSAAIHPMLPAVSDGRAPMFIEYQGYPFAAELAGGVPVNNGNAAVDKTTPFYRPTPHKQPPAPPPPPFQLLPRLAYGRRYETFAFVTSNAGTLPRNLQLDEVAAPWMPRPIDDTHPLHAEHPKNGETSPGGEVIGVDYQRTTAISNMTIAEPEGEAKLIGRAIDKVHPLAHDYPRAIVFASEGNTAHCDLFRSQGGFGEIAIPLNPPKSTSRNVTMSEIRWGGKPKAIRIEIMDRLSDQPHVIKRMTREEIERDGLDGERTGLAIDIPVDERPILTVTFRTILPPVGSGVPNGRFVVVDGKSHAIPPTFAEACWLRLVIEAGDDSASVSFAEVEGAVTAAAGGPLLLLAPKEELGPKETTAWNDGIAKQRTVAISIPRVTYGDFERWYANPDKRAGLDAPLGYALLMANLLRHGSEKLANLIDRLPDPAVSAVRIDFAEIDSLSAIAPAPRSETIDISGWLKHFFNNEFVQIAKLLPPIEKGSTLHRWTVEALETLLKALDEKFRFSVRFASDKNFGLEKGVPYVARSPAGCVTRLTLHAHVPMDHFAPSRHPSMFDVRLLQYATLVDDVASFQGASVRMEVMADALADGKAAIDLAERMIDVEPVDRVRRYDLKTRASLRQASDAEHWRLLSEIDVTTQRWRPSGRPIYRYVRPRDHANDDWIKTHPNAVAWPLTIDKKLSKPGDAYVVNEKLARFEHEAFFDRPDFDAHTVTQRLKPLGSRTVLQEFPWEAPSATYFRHRFTLRSRYAGALREADKRECAAWAAGDDKKDGSLEWAKPWTKRVVMLADASRILLTRPQLRALIPLTTAPDADGRAQPAPPVAAILQEPPSAFGLADRIAAEVKTGFGYGFNDTQPKEGEGKDIPPVEILDSRKEAGPVPYLTYRPLMHESALGMTLVAEGPMGLTFDQIDVPAPAFPNSMLTLRPTTWLGEEPPLEELMMGVAMRRYIDPHWTTAGEKLSPKAKPLLLGLDQSWLIAVTPPEWVSGQPVSMPGLSVDATSGRLPLLALTLTDGIVTASAFKTLIDGVDRTGKPIEIARFEMDRCADILVLHQPVAPGRYCSAVLATPKTPTIGQGGSNVPVVMASFEWSLPKDLESNSDGAGKARPPQLSVARKLKPRARPTIASAQTFMRWTKTSRDFDFVHVAEKNGSGWKPNIQPVRGLVASVAGDGTLTVGLGRPKNDVWLCSSTFTSQFPLHVHRHVAVVTTRLLNELGRPVERYQRSAASGARQPKLSGQQDGDEDACRIVEYETPAAILCDFNRAVPATYKTAYFDLFSSGFKDGARVILFFRFVAPFAHEKPPKTITLELWSRSAEKEQDKKDVPDPRPAFPLNWPTGYGGITGLYVTIETPDGKPTFDFLTESGERVRVTSSKQVVPLNGASLKKPGLCARISSDADFELWTDVSLLHSAGQTSDGPFNFDWLFSATGVATPVEAVSPAKLNEMSEAQARIVAVSPPIPLV